MRFTELEAAFIKVIDERTFRYVGISYEEAQGILFLCPKCFIENKGSIGTHSIICWFLNKDVPDNMPPLPGRWIPQGTCIDDLTFIGPNAASILLTGGCAWHGFIKNGDAT